MACACRDSSPFFLFFNIPVSPYLKTLSMVAAIKLLHLLEAFSTPWFLFSAPSNHHLVFFLLEIFNNIIQYQFDGNANLVYTIIRKRHVFHALANLPSDMHGISKCLNNRKGTPTVPAPAIAQRATSKPNSPKEVACAPKANGLPVKEAASKTYDDETSDTETKVDLIEESMEGSRPALPAEPGTLKASLLDTPAICQMTERESAHPLQAPLCDFSPLTEHCGTDSSEQMAKLSIRANKNEPIDDDEDDADESSASLQRSIAQRGSIRVTSSPNVIRSTSLGAVWSPTSEWVASWRSKLPLQTIMRLLQVLVPQVEKICIDK